MTGTGPVRRAIAALKASLALEARAKRDGEWAVVPARVLVPGDLVRVRMPFGKYKDRVLCDLPVSYLEWFNRKGFPPGKIGILLSALYEIKLNGLEYLLRPIRRSQP